MLLHYWSSFPLSISFPTSGLMVLGRDRSWSGMEDLNDEKDFAKFKYEYYANRPHDHIMDLADVAYEFRGFTVIGPLPPSPPSQHLQASLNAERHTFF